MNEFYQDLMSPFVHKWLMAHQGVKTSCQKCCLWIDGENVYGTIQFHEDNVVELTIKQSDNDEVIFYLHFQMYDMNSSLKQFQTFFQYLTKPIAQQAEIEVKNNHIKKILLSCSGGLTTSYFAYSIQELMNQKHIGIQVDAVAYTDIEKVADNYDIVLLAPQIAYMLPKLRKQYGCKIMSIEAVDFATSNFEGIIQKALH